MHDDIRMYWRHISISFGGPQSPYSQVRRANLYLELYGICVVLGRVKVGKNPD